jgi:hypothetical protein
MNFEQPALVLRNVQETVTFFLAHIQAEEMDASPVKLGQSVTHNITYRFAS